ncbi:MAG: 30S ribosomal protein S8 [Candidatus Omnitrophica bacterium]|nr:30S ribosomal protein S8 [Candidatus Omnitrophota bacterium]MBU1128444.1 30S ribosomal protein S8 [Candidatus Omnitrophota bacterium]MBU1657184.1 30S ribosomal protein S8 [Candidatus Omnitrophota bacterium]MBU1784434.1 30S ribosomal protein S8 [Candidatus Omnitrophota bacterium]MBU1851637.1 30S ribosomal protein S8 [Candidatus Omnitrophota bacterium]
MSCTDFVADQLTIIRNGIMAKKKNVIIRRSKFIEDIVSIVKREGFIDDYKVIEDNKQGKIKIYLKWLDDGTSVMEQLKKISTPGRRDYVSAKNVKNVMGGVGIAILSTSKGLMTDKEAKEAGVGGEVVCQVW